MKPHIKKIYGLWYCRAQSSRRIGLGYTPSQAYKDWAVK